jgi:Ca2+-transporting ATPase
MGINPVSLLFLPIHVVLLELVIDPTCSIVLERQPAETDIMDRKPRNPREKILNTKTLLKSVLQGIVIFAMSFGTYYSLLSQNPDNAPFARTMGLVIIILANLFLVMVNSSEYDLFVQTVKRLVKDKIMWAVNIVTIVGLLIVLNTSLYEYLKLAPLTIGQFFTAFIIAAASVLWYEVVKIIKKSKRNKNN